MSPQFCENKGTRYLNILSPGPLGPGLHFRGNLPSRPSWRRMKGVAAEGAAGAGVPAPTQEFAYFHDQGQVVFRIPDAVHHLADVADEPAGVADEAGSKASRLERRRFPRGRGSWGDAKHGYPLSRV